MKQKILAGLLLLCVLFLTGCNMGQEQTTMQNGCFTAEASDYNHGWKEFVTICVSDGQIVSIEYNARNTSGFIKSWDMEYMRLMNMLVGNYPNRYTRNYASQLIETQNPQEVDALAGATTSHASFQKLAEAAIKQAYAGNTEVALVDIGE